jgi:hypothetical protein
MAATASEAFFHPVTEIRIPIEKSIPLGMTRKQYGIKGGKGTRLK